MKAPGKKTTLFLLAAFAFPLVAWGEGAPDCNSGGTRIDPGLLRIESTKRTLGLSVDPRLHGLGRVRCQVELSSEIVNPGDLREWLALEVPEAEWEGHWKRWVQLTCPVTQVHRLGLFPGALVVARPPAPVPLGRIESEGTDILDAPLYWNLGHRGENIRIAVVDVGFDGYEGLLGSELPGRVETRSFYGSAAGRGDLTGQNQRHGTAVAEIVHDIAPAADLLLTNASTTVEMAKAVEWALEEGADVINHSVGWFFGPGDGTGEIATIVGEALDDDVVWVNAAGNFADAHWEGPYRDTDEDGVPEFDESGDENLNLGDARQNPEVSFILMWNRWPMSTDLYFDIEIWNGELLAVSSEADFQGYPYAFRTVTWEPDTGPVSIRIRLTDGDPGVQPGLRLEAFRLDGGGLPEHAIPRGSLVIPADVPDVIAVGAIHWSSMQLESFSSWGPNTSGVPKPELVAADGVSNSSFGTFRGTSAAAPHVAGAVALLHSAAPRGGMVETRWSVSEVRTFLQRSAEETGLAEDAVAWGIAKLPFLPRDVDPEAEIRVSPNPSGNGRAEIRLLLSRDEPSDVPWILRMYDVRGRRIWSTEATASELARGFSLAGREARAAGTYWIEILGPGLRSSARWIRLRE